MFTNSRTRVSRHTPEAVKQQIRQKMSADIHHCVQAGPQAIDHRLEELDAEWDIERTLEANAAALSLLGLFLGKTVSPKFYWLPTAVAGFLLQHALQGWCPPLPVLRRMGVRTTEEIDAERYALKMIRGDFRKFRKSDYNEVNAEGIAAALEAGKLT